MKFYVIEIAEGDARISGKAIYEYDTENKAVAVWHKKLSVARESDLYTSDLVMVVDSQGNPLHSEYYVATGVSVKETVEA